MFGGYFPPFVGRKLEVEKQRKIKHSKTHVDISWKQIAYIKNIDTNIFYAITNVGATSFLLLNIKLKN